ncbi:hypothetical protein NMG60_11030926 [Bertholletia excelsa]
MLQQESGGNGIYNHQKLVSQCTVEHRDSLSWKQMLEFSASTPAVDFQEKSGLTSDGNVGKRTNQGMLPSPSTSSPLEEQERCRWINFEGRNSDNNSDLPAPYSDKNLQTSSYRKYPSNSKSHSMLPATMLLSKEAGNFKFPVYSPVHSSNTNQYDFATIFDQSQPGMQLEADSILHIAQKQKFTIREISPDWGYASEATKVIIVGSFLCDPSDGAWSCLFGDTEVPVQIIQEGALCCLAPPNLPGNVTLSITSGNRESCSEVREFEYRVKPSSCTHCSSSQKETFKSAEEMLLLVRFVQMLLSDALLPKRDDTESGIGLWGKFKACEDSWAHVIETLLVGSWTSSFTRDWLLQELLKDKLQQWLSARSQGHDQSDCSLSKKEQGIIHMVAGLGFEWALSPILDSGVGINFRDINGWTALHWAAKFGRERMVAALLASGASAGLVTDPNAQDPTGKTPASIAAASGHKGLAGYLSEMALTGHLSSLKLEDNGITKSSADLEAEIAASSVLSRSFTTNEDQLSLKDTLAAVRNAAQAAAQIQAAFRAHSFRRRQQREMASAAATSVDEYSLFANDIQGISVASKLGYHNPRDYNTAALSIQKKFRGWKGRKDFLQFRQKVVKIQAHVRGHQVRKQYKVICWAVGVLEKVILRWRRKGVGLRGFRQEEDIDESEDEEFLKVFRKQKVDKAIDEAYSRVLSMVDSPDARQQYRRVLEGYHQVKAELEGTEIEVTSTSQGDISYMENEEILS